TSSLAAAAPASCGGRNATVVALLGVRLPGALRRVVRVRAPLRGVGGGGAGPGAGLVLAPLAQPRPARRDASHAAVPLCRRPQPRAQVPAPPPRGGGVDRPRCL